MSVLWDDALAHTVEVSHSQPEADVNFTKLLHLPKLPIVTPNPSREGGKSGL